MKKHLYLPFVMGALLCLLGWTGYAQGQRTPLRQLWEYHIDVTSDSPDRASIARENQRILDARAAEGWELTAVGNGFFYFKRAR